MSDGSDRVIGVLAAWSAVLVVVVIFLQTASAGIDNQVVLLRADLNGLLLRKTIVAGLRDAGELQALDDVSRSMLQEYEALRASQSRMTWAVNLLAGAVVLFQLALSANQIIEGRWRHRATLLWLTIGAGTAMSLAAAGYYLAAR